MLNGNEDGGGVGEGGGGMDGIHGKPSLINWKTLCGEACAAPSSSLTGGPINGLYSGHVLPLSLRSFPLRVSPNIKAMQ